MVDMYQKRALIDHQSVDDIEKSGTHYINRTYTHIYYIYYIHTQIHTYKT